MRIKKLKEKDELGKQPNPNGSLNQRQTQTSKKKEV
jgi:hypothetical protein